MLFKLVVTTLIIVSNNSADPPKVSTDLRSTGALTLQACRSFSEDLNRGHAPIPWHGSWEIEIRNKSKCVPEGEAAPLPYDSVPVPETEGLLPEQRGPDCLFAKRIPPGGC